MCLEFSCSVISFSISLLQGILFVSHFGCRNICITITPVQIVLLICFLFWAKDVGKRILGYRIDLSLTLFKKKQILPDYSMMFQSFYVLSRKAGSLSFSPAHSKYPARIFYFSILVCGDISCGYNSFMIK